jgi:hypothetical protein
MTEIFVWIEELPEAGMLFFFGASLLFSGALIRAGLQTYNRIAKKDRAQGPEAGLQVTQPSS